MQELTSLSLENDMDLIMAYRQGMKLAEIAGLTLSKQTSFATAVSEVCRDIIFDGKCAGELRLGVNYQKESVKSLVAVVSCTHGKDQNEGRRYAGRLVDKISIEDKGKLSETSMSVKLPSSTKVNDKIVERWSILMNNDPSITPYEEIKRKNKELQKMAERLRQSEQQYKTLTDSLPLMIFTLNENGEVTYANKWFLEYTGKSIESLNRTKCSDVLHPDEYAGAWKEWEYGVQSLIPRKTERRLLGCSGEYRWHAGATIPVFNDKGEVESYNAFLVDIDAQKKMEQALKDNTELKATKLELENKVRELNHSNQELEQFAYVASHDLQEPLRKISFYSDYLNSKFIQYIPDEGKQFLKNIATASQRMKQLIHDVLVYSTIGDHKEFTEVNLNDVMAEAIQDNEIAIKEKQAEIYLDELPSVRGIHVQLRQLFENLLSNSLKFTDLSRKPVVRVTSEINDGILELKFVDNGIGFEEQYVDKMFDLFQRLHSREKYEGTGIGLGICKKIVTLHSGTIDAKSEVGTGATFIVKLPLKQN